MQSVRLTYSSVEMNQIRFMNILKLLQRRNVIKDVDKIYKANKPDSMMNTVFKFKSDISDTKVAINLISNNISSIPKNSSIDDFLGQNINMIKILCFLQFQKKFINK